MKVLKSTLNEHRGYICLAALLLAVLFLTSPATATWSGSGAGTEGDPYQITTTSLWNEMNTYSGAGQTGVYFKLMNNIDFAGATPTRIGNGSYWRFKVDGNGKSVSNAVVPADLSGATKHVSLFHNAYSSSLHDISFINVDASFTATGTDTAYVGIIASGGDNNGLFYNINIDSTSSVTYSSGYDGNARVGTFAGWTNGFNIDNSSSLASVSANRDYQYVEVGGFAGVVSGTAIDRCYYGGTQTFANGHANMLHSGFNPDGEATGHDGLYYDSDKSPTGSDNPSSAEAKTTSQMTTQSTFGTFVFDSTHWKMSASARTFLGYPVWYLADLAAPTASFTMSQPYGYSGNRTVSFTDTSTGTPTSWAWSFGDGTSNSTSQSPADHVFAAPSTTTDYTVTLTATNGAGSTSVTHTFRYYIEPDAHFHADKTAFVSGKTVQFTDDSINIPDTWYWSLKYPNATYIHWTTQNPSFYFSTVGSYEISLMASNPSGNRLVQKVNYINVYSPVTNVNMLDSNPNPGSTGQTINFVGGSIYSGDGKQTVYDYGDGDGETTSLTNVYPSSGTYNAYIAVKDYDDVWHYDNVTAWVVISGTVTAGFTMSPTSGNIPLDVAFTDTSTGGTWASSVWNFGDGGSSTDRSPSHTYTAAGTYSPSLIWTNSAAASGYITHSITVGTPAAPSADWSANLTSGYYPLSVAFTDETTGGTAPITHAWSFGDSGTSTLADPTHTFATAGSYTVRLTETDANSRTSYHDGTITATSPSAPNADFELTNPDCYNYTGVFQSLTTGGVTPYTYLWQFSDGATGTTNPITHTWPTYGNVAVNLTVTDAYGISDFTQRGYIICTPLAPTSSFTKDKTSGYYPVTVAVTDESVGGVPPYTYVWDFGDGGATPTTKNASHTYTSAGLFTITQTVTDSIAHSHYSQQQFNSTSYITPTADFSMNVTSGNAPLTVVFTDTSAGTIQSYNWSFDDGTYSTLQNPTHTFAAATFGYFIKLTTVSTGGTASLTKGLTVLPTIPTASMTVTPITGQAPFLVTVNDTSTGAPLVIDYSVLYPDGTSGLSNKNPASPGVSFNFTTNQGGNYVITLTATNTGGHTHATQTVVANASGTPTPPINVTPAVTPIGATTAPNISHTLYPTVMTTTLTPIEAWLGDTALFQTNTSGITRLNGYNIDGWKVAVYKQKPMQPGIYQTPVSSVLVNASDTNSGISTFDVVLNTTETLTTGFNYGNATYVMKLFAINNSYVVPAGGTNYGNGLMLASSDDVNVEFVPPYVAWTSVPDPKPGDTVTLTWNMNSFIGTNQDHAILSMESMPSGSSSYLTLTGYGSLQVPESSSQSFVTTHAQILRARLVAYSSILIVPLNQITTFWYNQVIEDDSTAASFRWTNTAGNTIASAVDTDTIRYGLDTGNVWQNHNYPSLTLTFYKYNVATGDWDVLTVPVAETWTWGQQRLKESDTIVLSTVFTSADKTVKLRAVAKSGANTIVQSTDLTIGRNSMNPTNLANGAGGFMGLDAGLGGILFGTIIAMLIAFVAFFLVRDARVFIVGGLAGVAISFALGLYPIWLIVIIGIAGVAALLFASGILGGRGENGGSDPSAGGN